MAANVDFGNREGLVFKANGHGFFISMVIDHHDHDISVHAENDVGYQLTERVPYEEFPMDIHEANEKAHEVFAKVLRMCKNIEANLKKVN